MSNHRKLKKTGTEPAERCTSCGHRTGRLDNVLRLRTGQLICPRCQERGSPQRMACGHYVPAGALIIGYDGDSRSYMCSQCSTDAAKFGNARLGLAGR